MKVYLGGPIRSNEYVEWDIEWRRNMTKALKCCGIETLNPLDNQEFVNGVWTLNIEHTDAVYKYIILSDDIESIKRADILLMNMLFLGEHKGLGSFAEIGMGIILRKPIFIITQDEDIYTHPFIAAGVTFISNNLTDAADAIIKYCKKKGENNF